MIRRMGALALVWASLVTGCTSGQTQAVVALPPETANSIFAKDIQINVAVEGAPADLGETVRKQLQIELGVCATGKTPVTVQAFISDYEGPNAAKAFWIGHAVRLNGSVKLVADGNILGDYDIAQSLSGGGIIGAAVMEKGQEKVSSQFARELCTKAFGYKYSTTR